MENKEDHMIRRHAIQGVLYLWLPICFYFAVPAHTYAAELYITPAVFSLKQDEVYTFRIAARAIQDKINAVEATLNYPPDKLEILSVAKGGSILLSWIQDPSFSNSSGILVFAGGTPGTSFQGADGLVLQVTVRAKATGNAYIEFKKGSILKADGKGTDVLTAMQGATVVVQKSEFDTAPITSQSTVQPTPALPATSDENNASRNSVHTYKFDWSTIIIALFSILIFLLYIIHMHRNQRTTLRSTREARRTLGNTLVALREEIRERITELEDHTKGRELNVEEERIKKMLLSDIDVVERFIAKEIDTIEDDLLNRYFK